MTASLATCPLCAKQLAIPEGTSSDDRAECPECDATFLLSNAFQTSLPTARILEAIEASPENFSAELASQEKNSDQEKPSSKIPEVASLASWESRLKNAIEQDATKLTDRQSTSETPMAEQPRSSGPEFEFHIDPPLAEQTLETEKKPARQFEKVELLATEGLESLTKEMEVTSVADAPPTTEPNATELAEVNDLTIGLSTLHSRRARRFSPLKVAALLIGPGLLGTFLGLYALLWIKGPSGDLINLAKILPPAMLPPAVAVAEPESMKETSPADKQEPLVENEPVELGLPAEAEPIEPRHDHDPAVQQATAELPVPQTLNALPALFGELLVAARSAEPGLVEGDLSTNEAVSQKGQAYMAFCQLAQHFDEIHTHELDASSQAKIASAKELFVSLASSSPALGDLAAITSRWWGYESRPNQGIFFAGQIQSIQSLGGQTLYYVALDEPATATVVPVLLSQPPGREGDRIVVVGSIVAEPSTNLQGFAVEVPQVVVATYSQVLQP